MTKCFCQEGFDVFISAEVRNLWKKVGNDKLLSCFEATALISIGSVLIIN